MIAATSPASFPLQGFIKDSLRVVQEKENPREAANTKNLARQLLSFFEFGGVEDGRFAEMHV